MKRAFFSFSEILSVGVIILAACVLGAHLFGALSVDGASCDSEGVWSMGTRSMGMTASATAWTGGVDTTWYMNHSSDVNFTIRTPDELAGLATLVNGGNNLATKTITLLNDINLNSQDWTPIGTVSTNRPFAGTFNGGGHDISNLYINLTTDCAGLFGYIESGSEVKNVHISSGNVTGRNYLGGVVAVSQFATISNCHNASNVSGTLSTYTSIGGVVGVSSGTVNNCFNAGNVTGNRAVGGVVGYNDGTVRSCSNTGSVTGSTSAGGVVGENDDLWGSKGSTVNNCSNTGSVTGDTYVGGVVGWAYSGAVVVVATCEWVKNGGNALWGLGSNSTIPSIDISAISIVGVTVRPAHIKIDSNDVKQLGALVHPASADISKKSVTWSSNDPAVATVGANGLVTGVGSGITKIIVTTSDDVLGGGKWSADVAVEVVNITPSSSDPIKEMNDKLAPSGVQVNIVNSADFPSVIGAHVEPVAPAILCYEPSGKPAGVVEVDISDPNALMQMQYSLKLTESEISSRSNSVGRAVDTAKLFSHTGTPNATSIQEFFSVFVIQKEILQGARKGQLARLLGAGREEILTPQRAIAEGSLTMTVSSDKTLQIEFRYMVRDGDYSPYYDAAQKRIIIGDGLADKKIIDPLWVSVRKLTDRERGGGVDGGSGCAAVSTLPWWLLMGVLPLVVRRSK